MLCEYYSDIPDGLMRYFCGKCEVPPPTPLPPPPPPPPLPSSASSSLSNNIQKI